MSGKPTGRRKGRLVTLAVAVGAALLVMSAVAALPAGGAADAENKVPPRLLSVNVIRLVRQDHYAVTNSFVGRVEAARTSELGFEIPGIVTRIDADEGDIVEQGRVLAMLDTTRLEARRREVTALAHQAQARLSELENGPRDEVIAAARAEVERARAGHELATLTRERLASVYERQAASAHEWDKARLDVDTTAAGLESARQRLSELERGTRAERIEAQRAVVERHRAEIATIDVDIEKSRLRAPFGGTISARLIDEGRVLEPGAPLLRLLESDRLEAHVGVSAAAADALTIGAMLPMIMRDGTVHGRLRAIMPQRSGKTRTVTVILDLEAGTHDVRPGDVARLELSATNRAAGAWLPTTALVESRRGLWAAFVAVPDDHGPGVYRVEKHQLDVVHAEPDRVFVRGTFRDGDLVIADGVHRLAPGQLVESAHREIP